MTFAHGIRAHSAALLVGLLGLVFSLACMGSCGDTCDPDGFVEHCADGKVHRCSYNRFRRAYGVHSASCQEDEACVVLEGHAQCALDPLEECTVTGAYRCREGGLDSCRPVPGSTGPGLWRQRKACEGTPCLADGDYAGCVTTLEPCARLGDLRCVAGGTEVCHELHGPDTSRRNWTQLEHCAEDERCHQDEASAFCAAEPVASCAPDTVRCVDGREQRCAPRSPVWVWTGRACADDTPQPPAAPTP